MTGIVLSAWCSRCWLRTVSPLLCQCERERLLCTVYHRPPVSAKFALNGPGPILLLLLLICRSLCWATVCFLVLESSLSPATNTIV